MYFKDAAEQYLIKNLRAHPRCVTIGGDLACKKTPNGTVDDSSRTRVKRYELMEFDISILHYNDRIRTVKRTIFVLTNCVHLIIFISPNFGQERIDTSSDRPGKNRIERLAPSYRAKKFPQPPGASNTPHSFFVSNINLILCRYNYINYHTVLYSVHKNKYA